jgi:hypothetical protein
MFKWSKTLTVIKLHLKVILRALWAGLYYQNVLLLLPYTYTRWFKSPYAPVKTRIGSGKRFRSPCAWTRPRGRSWLTCFTPKSNFQHLFWQVHRDFWITCIFKSLVSLHCFKLAEKHCNMLHAVQGLASHEGPHSPARLWGQCMKLNGGFLVKVASWSEQRPWSLGRWDHGFESRLNDGCLPSSFYVVLYCVPLCDGLISRQNESYWASK